MGRSAILWSIAALGLSACSDAPPVDEKPIAPVAVFEGLPLSGNMATALAAGFGNCHEVMRSLRCLKDGVMIVGVGPLNAAVDIDQKAENRSARFDHVTLWHGSDQSAMLPVKAALEGKGWKSCLTTEAERFWKPPSPLRIAMDTSYWGKRRLVISAPPPDPKPYCPPS